MAPGAFQRQFAALGFQRKRRELMRALLVFN